MTIPTPTIKRLIVYRRHLEKLQKENVESIYSHDLADQLGLTAAIIRKDISTLGSLGDINEGYNVEQLKEKINSILGTNKTKKIVLIGAGNIGKALLGYKGFSDRGFDIVKVFDNPNNSAFTRLISLSLRHGANIQYAVEQMPESDDYESYGADAMNQR